ncbi:MULTISPECIES: DNA mismatch repair protein MutS [Segatella]|jgi:DNA mismatch repair protein MutS|uniref:DNA mismatch repair protein MutS n=2 Tax=Segatella bryantii TaxID=77095 RepID=A0AA37MLH6_SEGBR|nr:MULTISPECIES: DNA mismatch repair protein MutS [Segatella]MBQ3857321.1 DNA mismatch repair protein MutS [Prevotella sp.]MEE3414403.1 DNA mismatch repair protein MutS [Prevotella sp.]UKK77877.1 DNA mismatch repair protein MutS [Segatella baroniae B14]SDL41795.1 DNA mismatch repair protein MutS [Segatella bryantii]SEA37384.1 DNA mismatch repair protein MutS [Segatella bryantii]
MAKDTSGLTPMMKQFFSMKAQHPDALLLFRCGDFYETYGDDAIEASKVLGITLTRRNNGGNTGQMEMAGFPHHALDTYLPKLIRAGKRVAICDQLEDPKKKREALKGKKGLTEMDKMVKRGITELVTPGVALDDNVLNYKENNFLAAVHFGKNACGISFLDISTGEFLTGEGTYDYVEKLIGNFMPKEILYDRAKKEDFERFFGTKLVTFELDDWVFTEQTARQKLLKHFGTKNLKGFGVEHLKNGVIASGAIMQYLEITQHTHINHITSLSRIEEEKYVRMDNFTIRSLELVSPMQEEGSSLLKVIDHTITPMGGRMLRRWVVFPLKSVKPIDERLNVVEYFFREPEFRECIDDQLHRIGDLERIISKVAVGRVSPREVVQLRVALDALRPIKTACLYAKNEDLKRIGEQLNLCESLKNRIEQEIQPDPPQLVNKGDVIADGYNAELDELRSISRNGRDYLLKIQEQETEKTGISSLKVGYNNVFGYYLEVRNTYKDKVPAEWIRKQTLAQAERYITQELKEYEEKILGADERILSLEAKLFSELIVDMQAFIPQIQINANLIAQLDCLLSFAAISELNHYVRPVVDDSEIIDIKQGRHPVIETQLPIGEQYVPNDVYLDNDKQQVMMITGPNMAGKSALLRQTALIVLLAQIGCFVPAEGARIGLVDKIFTRVGASDNISLGESTFMVEMTEASNILNNVTPRSLVLFDELGRGTSTYDGISIAWAIVEYLHEHSSANARTLFATHYHELNEMEKLFSRIKNYNVSVKEVDGKVIFLRKLERGGSNHSFGIHVAEIAGMPKSIVKRAHVILKQLENENSNVGSVGRPQVEKIASTQQDVQLSFFQLDDPILCQVRDEILGLDINNLTPVEALNKLNEIKKIVSGK